MKQTCLIAVTALTIGLSLTACGGNDNTTSEATTTETVSDDNSQTEDTAAEADNQQENASSEAGSETDNTNEQATTESDSSDEGTTMYTTESITLHEEASGSSEDLGVVPVGSTLIAYETYGDYIKVEFNDKDGYVLKEYVTDDKAAADKALEAAKQAESSSSSSSQSKSSGSKKSSKKSTECLDNGLLN